MTAERPTNSDVPTDDLFSRVERYYREDFKRVGRREDFDRWMSAARDDLRGAAVYGADPAFLLHVLICTAGRGIRVYADEIPALRALPKRQAAQLVGAFRLLLDRGEAWLRAVFRGQSERAASFYSDVAMFYTLLVGTAITTPAWESGGGRRPRSSIRGNKNALTACIICLHEALERAPKPIMTILVLLEKFELLKGRQSAIARAKLIEQRIRRKKTVAADLLGPVGHDVGHLKGTFAEVKEFLGSPEGARFNEERDRDS